MMVEIYARYASMCESIAANKFVAFFCNYQDSSVNLKSGDRLLLFTDGITEAEDAQGEEFGVDRVAAPAGRTRPVPLLC
jgi:Stage II sporulation protein E (SpoIIE)